MNDSTSAGKSESGFNVNNELDFKSKLVQDLGLLVIHADGQT